MENGEFARIFFISFYESRNSTEVPGIFREFLEDGNTEKNQFKGEKMCRGVTSERGFPHLNACITAHSHIESYLAYKKYDLQTKGIL